MVFAAIFAGGSGSRMGAEKPKQYLSVCGKPILVHTVEKFIGFRGIDKTFVLCPPDWIEETAALLRQYFGDDCGVDVIAGGETRNDTLLCALDYVDAHTTVDGETLLLTHDAVRPFINDRILRENIEAAARYGACDTAVPATDTIVDSADGQFITEIPPRSRLFYGQTPQSFNVRKLRDVMTRLTPEEVASLTDACKIFAIKGEPVYIVRGEPTNIKITYPSDLKLAEAIARD